MGMFEGCLVYLMHGQLLEGSLGKLDELLGMLGDWSGVINAKLGMKDGWFGDITFE